MDSPHVAVEGGDIHDGTRERPAVSNGSTNDEHALEHMHSTDPAAIPMIDPHVHFWDVTIRPNENLGEITAKYPRYTPSMYYKDVTYGGIVDVEYVVHIETVVGQSIDVPIIDSLSETAFIADLKTEGTNIKKIAIVSYLDLTKPHAEVITMLDALHVASKGALVGIRMIWNYDASEVRLTWPGVSDDFTEKKYHEALLPNLRELANRGLIFELQCNPEQLLRAAEIFECVPTLKVAINHAGCPRVAHRDGIRAADMRQWDAGMRRLATNHNVWVKISMLWFVDEEWACDDSARARVVELLGNLLIWFGPARLMVASNFPVDRYNMPSIQDVIGRMLSALPPDIHAAVLYTNAYELYVHRLVA